MRRRVSRNADTWGEEVIVDDPEDRHKSRNINANTVGRAHENTVHYDEIGSGLVAGPKTVKIESTPGYRELYSGDVAEGDTVRVYWGIKKVE